MTANQVAFQKAKEEARANRRQEELKAYEQGIKNKEALASMRQANAAYMNAIVNSSKNTREWDESGSKKFANIGSGIGGIAKGVSGLASVIGALFA